MEKSHVATRHTDFRVTMTRIEMRGYGRSPLTWQVEFVPRERQLTVARRFIAGTGATHGIGARRAPRSIGLLMER